jgi:mannose-1-phosphate guanylyltransferase
MGALIHLVETGFTGSLAIFPADHYVSDDAIFMEHVSVALRTVDHSPGMPVLLGVQPDGPETDYGWIEPDGKIIASNSAAGPIRRICRFWEKPTASVASALYERGCLWNSFILVANVETLLKLMAQAVPELFRSLAALRSGIGAIREDEVLRRVYRDSPSVDFSSQVLVPFSGNFAVLPVTGVRWSDLGDPRRLLAISSHTGAISKRKIVEA